MSPAGPEDKARTEIDRLLTAAGWHVCDFGSHDISKPCAIREFPLKQGHGHADYLLYLQGKAVGVIEAKKVGHPLKGVETQSVKYTTGQIHTIVRAFHDSLPKIFPGREAEHGAL